MPKKQFITLMIDEKVHDYLNGVLWSVGPEKSVEIMKRLGLRDEAMAFLKEFSRASHDAGWCKDEDCKDKINGN